MGNKDCVVCFDKICSCKDNYKMFHGYKVYPDGTVIGKFGEKLTINHRVRRGGKLDACVRLVYGGKQRKWTLSRLVVACFVGPVDGYQVDHKDRNPMNNHLSNLERVTASENQLRWREDEKKKEKKEGFEPVKEK